MHIRTILLCSCVGFAGPVGTAHALQQGPGASAQAVDEIVVTARRKEEALKEVPASVSSLDREFLTEAGVANNFGDTMRILPGVTLVDVGSNQSEVSIRGAGSGTARTAGVDSPVAVLKDGASITGGNIGGRSYLPVDTFDQQRIEVVRGPQGGLYGINAVGGVINLITRRPGPEFGASIAAAGAPGIERYDLRLLANTPLAPGLSARFGLEQGRRDGGFFYNAVTRKHGDIEYRRHGRVALLWNPGDNGSIYSSLSVGDDVTPPGNVRALPIANDPAQANSTTADLDGPYIYGNDALGLTKRTVRDWLTIGDIELAGISITSTTAFRDRSSKAWTDGDNTAVGYAQANAPTTLATCFTRRCQNVILEETEMASQDIRLSGEFGSSIDWMAGASLNARQSDQASIQDGRTTSAANLNPSPTQNNATIAKEEELQYGAYGWVSWSPLPRLTLDAAGRYNISKKKTDAYAILRIAAGSACGYTNPYPVDPASSCALSRALLEETFRNFAPSLSTRFELAPNARIFASVARGYRAGGFNTTSINDPLIPATFDPESTTALEGGIKFEVAGAAYTLTYFKNDYSNQLLTLTSQVGNVSRNYRTNVGRAETYGVDAEVVGRFRLPETRGTLSYTAGLNWLKGGPLEGPYAGRDMEGSPVWAYTAALIWTVPVWRDWDFSASATYRGQRGGFTTTPLVNNRTQLDDFDLFGGRLALQSPNWQVEAVVTNLTNTAYAALQGPIQNIYNDPRYVTFRVTRSFGSEARR